MRGPVRWLGGLCLGLLAGTLGAQTPGAAASTASTASTASATALQRWHVRYDVAADGRAVVTRELHQKVLQPQGLAELAVYDFASLAGLQQASVLQAYTQKADGRRIDAVSDTAAVPATAGEPARERTTVRFADVAVGDTVALEWRVQDSQPLLPGSFSLVHRFSPYTVQEDSRITVRAPKGLNLRFEAHGLQEEPAREEEDATERSWSYRNTAPRSWSAADEGLWRLEETPVLLASSFADYAALAQAYAAQAPQAEPTAALRALAQDITAATDNARERARLLYEWVSTHITTQGRCMALGAMAPKAPDAVLAQRSGDCQDQALLLQALLGAVGIRSERVLMNQGDVYQLPDLPVFSVLDHMVNYLPDEGLYLDAASPLMPFGYLPAPAYGKAVVHVGSTPTLQRIPDGPADANGQSVHTTLRVAADGSASGRMRVEFQGPQAPRMRDHVRRLDVAARQGLVQQWLARSGHRGTGVLDTAADEGQPLLADRYVLELSFELAQYLQTGAPGAFVLAPVVDLPLSVVRLAVGHWTAAQRPVRCYGYDSEERYDITLAPGVSFTRLPPDYQVRGTLLRYSGHFGRTPHGITVQRSLRDRTPQGLCQPATLQAWVEQVQPIAQSLQSPVYYRLPAVQGGGSARVLKAQAKPAPATRKPAKKKQRK